MQAEMQAEMRQNPNHGAVPLEVYRAARKLELLHVKAIGAPGRDPSGELHISHLHPPSRDL